MKKEEKKAIRKLIHRLIPLPKGTIVYLKFRDIERKGKILSSHFDKERNCFVYTIDILGTPWFAFRTIKDFDFLQTDLPSDRSSNLAGWEKE
ncbi:MAG: hypothetical protein DRN81_07000 [Thermoproteota archaeon]|nr:MAG: hypothetical protein DRN81_07000 [Candidatus Korarchaeota archaeon]